MVVLLSIFESLRTELTLKALHQQEAFYNAIAFGRCVALRLAARASVLQFIQDCLCVPVQYARLTKVGLAAHGHDER